MSMTLNDYLDLITSQHRRKAKFRGVAAAAIAPLASNIGFIDTSFLQAWDLDTAVGTQLDQVGEWIGTTRFIEKPITGYYFTWEDTVETGWEHGYWQGKYDPSTGVVALGDDIYRIVLYAKIASNNWDGTRQTMEHVWNDAFGGDATLSVIDHQDMSITLSLIGVSVDSFFEYILRSGRVPLKPEGVRIRKYMVNKKKIFAFDLENRRYAGFDVGEWATVIS